MASMLFLLCQTQGQVIVQIAAYETPVSISYFEGLDGVNSYTDQNDIRHYYIGGFSSAEEAEPVVQQVIAAGYPNARVENLSSFKDCGCYLPDSFTPKTITNLKKLKSIFFDFDKAFLRGESEVQLSILAEILHEQPSYFTEIRAHTDSKGSLEYNRELSHSRAASVRKYLSSKGISLDRIRTSTSGEEEPIAKNELEGKDTQEGRQLNRRVELLVIDETGEVLNDLVEKIFVPDHLKY